MSNFFHQRHGEARAPECEVLPDDRKRLTRFVDLAHKDLIATALATAYGTVHEDNSNAPSGWSNLRLVNRKVTDEVYPKGKDTRPALVLVYETLPATAEIQVGLDTKIELEDGRDAVEQEFLQLVAGSYSQGVAGSSGSVGYLQKEEMTNDGTLRRIKRTYVASGTISQDDQSLNDGKLLKRTIVSVKDVPSTPSGYTLVGSPVQNPNGLPIYTYTYYKGNGEISRDTSYGQSGDQGTTGITRITITHLTPSSTSSDPTSTPSGTVKIAEAKRDEDGHRVWTIVYAKGTGEVGRSTEYGQSSDQGGSFGTTVITITHLTLISVTSDPTSAPGSTVKVSESKRDEDGVRVWTVRYAKGTGLVVDDKDTKNGGKLIIYHRVALGSAPATPSASISGTVATISTNVRKEAGYDIYDYTFAEGNGEISRETSYRIKGGINSETDPGGSLTVITVRHLTALSVTDNPTTIADYTFISVTKQEADGHRIWASVWANGTGLVTEDQSERHNGKLIIHHLVSLDVEPTTPDPDTSGVVYVVERNVRQAEGHVVFDYTFAEGYGEISRKIIQRDGGARIIEIVVLSDPAGDPIDGTTGLDDYDTDDLEISRQSEDRDGYRVTTIQFWDSAGLNIQTSYNERRREDGSTEYTIERMGDSGVDVATVSGAYEVLRSNQIDGALYRLRQVFIKPPADRNFTRTVSFQVPGLATAANPPTFVPPITRKLKATVYEAWSTSQNADTLYTITNWASLHENYKRADTGEQVSTVKALDGYVGSSSMSGSNTTYRGIEVTAFAIAVGGSTPTAKPSGATVLDADSDIYLVALDGTVVYKNTSIKFTF